MKVLQKNGILIPNCLEIQSYLLICLMPLEAHDKITDIIPAKK